MAEVVTSSLLRLVCDKLGSKLMEEFGLFMGVKKELSKLESTLNTIQDVLEDAEARQVKEKALNGWLRKLKDVAFEADDLLDDAATEVVRRKEENKTGIKGKVRKLASIPNSIVSQSKIARRIKTIQERLDEISVERSKFHLREGSVVDYKIDNNARREESGPFVLESEVFGREEDREKIVEFLTDTSVSDNTEVMVIVGMGGLGKTTIAQLVYNDERVSDHFENRIWVCVSNDFEIKRVIESIMESVTGSNIVEFRNIELMQRKLRERLGGKRFLLVLDDVWSENHEKWDKLRDLLTIGAKGSKVIVTTRSNRVASLIGTVEPYNLSGLSEDDCWLLFEKRAFKSGSSEICTNLVAIGKDIVKKCGGIPLAAKALGSLMRFKTRESQWLTIRDNDIWRLSDEENEILPALRLSYNDLPHQLKQCFAYCSIFPKNSVIWTNELIELWIAEGFIRSSKRREDLRDLGMTYVEELFARSLFQYGSEELDKKISCIKMHDLVYDLAQAVAGEECTVVETCKQIEIAESTRFSSFICGKETIPAMVKPLLMAKKLRTLRLVASNENRKEHNWEEVLQDIFSNLKLLRALKLSYYPLEELPNSVKYLTHLRYLNLSRTSIKTLPSCIGHLHNLGTLDLGLCGCLQELPESIGNLSNLTTLILCGCFSLHLLPDSIGCLRSLQNLDLTRCQLEKLPESLSNLTNMQILRLRSCYFLHELPTNISKMKSLVHLDLDSCLLECMPSGIGELSCLRTLPFFIPGGKSNCSLGELGGLKLEGKLEIRDLQNVKAIEEARKANMIEKYLESLSLSWNLDACKSKREECDDSDEQVKTLKEYFNLLLAQEWCLETELVEGVCESLKPHKLLRKLNIKGYLGGKFPEWLMGLTVPNLVELTLTSCIRCEILPNFNMLKDLKSLELSLLPAVKSLPSLGQVPSLEILKLSLLPSIKYLGSEFYGGNVAFVQLEELELCGMSNLEEWFRVDPGYDFFPRLSKLSLVECPKLSKLPSNFLSVTSLAMCVEDDLLLSSLEGGGFPNLKHMKLNYLTEDNEDESLPEIIEKRLENLESWSLSS